MDVKQNIEAAEAAYRKRSPRDFLLFTQGLKIPSAQGPQLFNSCIQPFQMQCFEDLYPSLTALKNGTLPPRRRWWIERTKKASKDADLAVILTWLVAFPTRPFYIQVGAADRDQAAIVRRRMKDLLYYNPWLEEHINVSQYRATHANGLAEVDIIAADVAGSHGETPDLLVINELSHVTKWEFVLNLLDNADGVPQGMIIIATNAGFKGTKAETLKIDAERSDEWEVRVWDRPAPWIAETDVAEAKRRGPPSRYSRLWWGRWVSGKGDALNEDNIERCFSYRLEPLSQAEPGWLYVAGLDLGVSHDHSGLVVLGVNLKEQMLRVAWMKGWAPDSRTGEVDLMEVENACFAVYRNFRVHWLGYDPTEARLMAQRLARRGVPMRGVPFTGKNLTEMAESLIQVIEAGKLQCFDDPEHRLRTDFGKFNIVEKSYGYRLEAVSDERGHADVGTALVICLPRALQLLSGVVGVSSEDLGDENDQDFTDEEVEELPDELKDIYGDYEEMAEDHRIEKSDRDFGFNF